MKAAREALARGELDRALTLQTAVVEARPNDSPARLFLFELLVIAGRGAEAFLHLEAVESADPEWPEVRRGFERILQAQSRRQPTLRRPRFYSEPPVHARRRWNAALNHRQGLTERARRWLDAADEATPEVRGFIDGREFVGFRDSDDRFASVLEVIAGGRYVWVPFEQIARVKIEPAEFALDSLFRPIDLLLEDGREVAVTLPLTYPNSADAGDQFALAQAVDWKDDDGALVIGIGAKVFNCGDEEISLAECQMIEFTN
jgi:type VI secretion system protein ImpE